MTHSGNDNRDDDLLVFPDGDAPLAGDSEIFFEEGDVPLDDGGAFVFEEGAGAAIGEAGRGGESSRAASPRNGADRGPWTILVVDDDEGVRLISQIALRDLEVDGRPIRILMASSGDQAREILSREPNIAVALVDVVMRTEMAGLNLVRWIRRDHGDALIRLIIRTGQPGNAPETEVMESYDIHDYMAKTETTARRLATGVIGAVRAWRDLKVIERQRQGVSFVLAGVEQLVQMETLVDAVKRLAALVWDIVEGSAGRVWVFGHRDHGAKSPAGSYGLWSAYPEVDDEDTGVEDLARRASQLAHRPAGELFRDYELHGYRFDLDDSGRSLLLLTDAKIHGEWHTSQVEILLKTAHLVLRDRHRWALAVGELVDDLSKQDTLLRGVYARVNRNLQLISSVLELQRQVTPHDEARRVLDVSRARVHTVAMVYRALQAEDHSSTLDVAALLGQLVGTLQARIARSASVEMSFDSCRLHLDQAIPLMMMVSDLVSNALEYGFEPGSRAQVEVRAAVRGGRLEVVVADRGPGFPAGVDPAQANTLGLTLVRTLADQLGAGLSFEPGGGVRVRIEVPLERSAPS